MRLLFFVAPGFKSCIHQDQRDPASSGKKASFTYPANEVNFIFKYPCCAVESVSATTYVFGVAVAIPTKP